MNAYWDYKYRALNISEEMPDPSEEPESSSHPQVFMLGCRAPANMYTVPDPNLLYTFGETRFLKKYYDTVQVPTSKLYTVPVYCLTPLLRNYWSRQCGIYSMYNQLRYKS